MKSVGVFCGSSAGNNPRFREAAYATGQALAQSGVTLVYGGAKDGLMGAVADGALDHGGEVIGVLPRFLVDWEIAHEGLTKMVLCETMAERKAKMFELSEAYVALPGGFGTLDEALEVLTLRQVGQLKSPLGFLNVDGFYDGLEQFFESMKGAGLLSFESKQAPLFYKDLKPLLETLAEG